MKRSIQIAAIFQLALLSTVAAAETHYDCTTQDRATTTLELTIGGGYNAFAGSFFHTYGKLPKVMTAKYDSSASNKFAARSNMPNLVTYTGIDDDYWAAIMFDVTQLKTPNLTVYYYNNEILPRGSYVTFDCKKL